MRTAVTALAVVLTGCIAQTAPERDPLPRVEEVVGPVVACSFGLGSGSGVTVSAVMEGSPSDGALSTGDVLITLDGQPLTSFADLRSTLAERAPGDDVVIGVERDASELEVTVRLGAAEDDPDRPLMGIEGSTNVESRSLAEVGGDQVEGPYVRVIEIGGTLYRFDPVEAELAETDLTTPTGVWEIADGRLFSVNSEDSLIDDQGVEQTVPDGFEVLGLLGGVDQDLIVALRAVEDGTLSVMRLDPANGEPVWQNVVEEPGVVPVGVFTTPDGHWMVVVFASPETNTVAENQVWAVDDGTEVEIATLDVAAVFGWFSPDSIVGMNEDGSLVQVDPATGVSTPFELPTPVAGESVVDPVGDGRYVLVRTGRDLMRADLDEQFAEQRELIHNCDIGALGRSGGDL